MASKSSTTTRHSGRDTLLPPVHPGEVLEQEFILPLGLTAYRVATDIGVSVPTINEIVLGKRSITARTALRLAKYFGTSERFWLGLQTAYDLDVERDRGAEALARIESYARTTARVVRPRGAPAARRTSVTASSRASERNRAVGGGTGSARVASPRDAPRGGTETSRRK
jgi:addiction module HigA family antidote